MSHSSATMSAGSLRGLRPSRSHPAGSFSTATTEKLLLLFYLALLATLPALGLHRPIQDWLDRSLTTELTPTAP